MSIEAVAKYCDALWGARDAVNSGLEEIARHVAPERAGFNAPLTPGDEGRDQIWDSTPEDAALTLAAALHGMLTNPATDWLDLDLQGIDDDADTEGKGFVEAVTRAMLDVFSDADGGFQQEVNIFYLDLVCFGWAVFLALYRDGKGPVFRAVPPSQCSVGEDADGRVDAVLRRWTMTPGQLVEEFGVENVSDAVKQAIEGGDPQKPFAVSHLVAPRHKLPKEISTGTDAAEKGRGRKSSASPARKPFLSIHYETQSKKVLREGGFDELPYMVPRWSKRSGEVYGRGPGHACLPDMRVLNRVALSQLIGAEKLADPPMLAPDDSIIGKLNTHHGGITTFRPMGQGDEIRQLPVSYKLEAAEIILEKRRDAIRAAFLNDRIQLAGGPQMTATEVIARERKQNLVLGPVLGRLESEFLGPLTDRVFMLLYRAGAIAVPGGLAGRNLRARYISPIGRAQRQGEAEAFARTVQYLAPLLGVRPDLYDNFNLDAVVRDTQELFGYPSEYLQSEEQLANIRKSRAEAQQAAAMAEMAAKAQGAQA